MELSEKQELSVTEFAMLLQSISKGSPNTASYSRTVTGTQVPSAILYAGNTRIRSNGIADDRQCTGFPLVRS